MKPSTTSLSRRRFIAAAGATALAARVSSASVQGSLPTGFAFAGSRGELRVYFTRETTWTHVQTIASEAPLSLAADPSTGTLHVLHRVAEYRGLPCGYVESFQMERRTGQLRLLSSQPLSLSATLPSHMALSPDGGALAVAVYGGAAYNLLPILRDGRAGRPIAMRKETGLSSGLLPRPAHVAFSASGDRVFALDRGTATLSVLSAQAELPVLSRLQLSEGGDLSHLAVHADANVIFVTDAGSGSLFAIRHDPASADLSLQTCISRNSFRGPLAIHSSSQSLIAAAADSIDRYRIQPETGELEFMQRLSYPRSFSQARSLVLDGRRSLLYFTTESGVYSSAIGRRDGYLSSLNRVAPAADAITVL
jgi:6-phosphogluconolactonase (cycloisomerase 2 family)